MSKVFLLSIFLENSLQFFPFIYCKSSGVCLTVLMVWAGAPSEGAFGVTHDASWGSDGWPTDPP